MNIELEMETEAVTGVSNEEWMVAQEPRFHAIVETGAFPVFTRYVSQDYDANSAPTMSTPVATRRALAEFAAAPDAPAT